MTPDLMSFAEERLTDRHFTMIAQLVESSVGIQLPPAKRIMVEGRVRRRVRALGLKSLEAYGAYLLDEGGLETEFVHLVDCVTTNKTDFFREPMHFEFLCTTALPRLLTRGPDRRLKLWSAACSIGAEAYTIAMVLQEQLRLGAHFSYSILGTDISTEVLEQAEAAIYPESMMDPVPPALRQRYVMTARHAGQQTVRIVPELRQTTQFHRLNLMDDHYPFDHAVDVIFCRNVLIYFDKASQAAVIGRLVSHLRPGGYLILGHSESMAGAAGLGLTQILPTVFQAQKSE